MSGERPATHRSVATVCLSGTLEDKLTAAAGAGFSGIEVFEPDLIASPWSPREVAARCADLGLSIDLYQLAAHRGARSRDLAVPAGPPCIPQVWRPHPSGGRALG